MKLPPPPAGNFDPAPAGNHIGICIKIVDAGTQKETWEDEVSYKRKLVITWELCGTEMEDGRPYTISRWYTFSSSPKSNLRKDLESWRGRQFTNEELEGFKIESCLGIPCMVNVVAHEKRNGDVVTNVANIAPMAKGVKIEAPVNDVMFLSLEPDEFNEESFLKLSERMQERIKLSPEWDRIAHPEPETVVVGTKPEKQSMGEAEWQAVVEEAEGADEIPF